MSHPLLPKNPTKTAALVEQYLGETELNVMRGNVDGEVILPKYGINANVSAGDDIWDGGGVYSGFSTAAAEFFEIVCSSANDTNSSGTGARKLRVWYLNENYEMFDSNGDYLSFDVNLNGGSVVTSTKGMRIWRAKVIDSGSTESNEGTITIRWATTTSVIFTVIAVGAAQTNITAFTIPAGYTGYLKAYRGTIYDNTANRGNFCIRVRDFGTNTFRKIRNFGVTTEGSPPHELYGGEQFQEKTDFVFSCLAILNANGDTSIEYGVHLVKNSV